MREAFFVFTIAWLTWASVAVTDGFGTSRLVTNVVLPATITGLTLLATWKLSQPASSWVNACSRVALVMLSSALALGELNNYWAIYYFGPNRAFPWPFGAPLVRFAEALRVLVMPLFAFVGVMTFARVAYLCRLARRPGVLIAVVVFSAASAVMTAVSGEARFALGAMFLGIWVAAPIWSLQLAYTFTRAIALGGLPAASSRSSPAPRPPA